MYHKCIPSPDVVCAAPHPQQSIVFALIFLVIMVAFIGGTAWAAIKFINIEE